MRNTILKLLLFVFPCLISNSISSQPFQQGLTNEFNESPRVYEPNNEFVLSEVLGTIVWLGITNDWSDPQNWWLNNYPGYGLPTVNTDVLIPVVASGNYPVISKGQVGTCNHLTIQTGGPTLTISNGADLNCFGNLINNGEFTNNGKLNLMGVENQQFPGPGILNAMNVLQISKTAGSAVLNNHIFIDSALLPTSGVLALGNYDITLKSGPNRTAYVGNVGSSIGFTYANGKFIVQRYISKTRRWQLLSTPTNSSQSIFSSWQDDGSSTTSPTGFGVQITGPVVANGIDRYSSGYSMKAQVGCTPSFVPVTNTLNPLLQSKGYFVYVYGNRASGPGDAAGGSTTLQSRGKLFVGNQQAGDQPPAVTATANVEAGNDHMSVGNPFAAPLNFTSLLNHSVNSAANIKSNFKVWDPSQDGEFGSGLYQTITGPTGWMATPGGGTIYNNSSANFSIIQTGQAFYVEAKNSGTVSVEFRETMKAVQNKLVNREFSGPEEIDPTSISMLSSFLRNANGKLLDGNRIVFAAEYTDSINDDDAGKLWNAGANFSILKQNKSFSVEARSLLKDKDTIQFELYGLYEGGYQLLLQPQLLDAAGMDIFLADRYLRTETAISINDSTLYYFNVSSDVASYAPDRFYIFVKKRPQPLQFVAVNARWFDGHKAKIEWDVAHQDHTVHFQLQYGRGELLFQNAGDAIATNGNSYSKELLLPDAAKHYFRVKAVDSDGSCSFSETVLLSKAKDEKMLVAPNPLQHKQLDLQLQDFVNGNYLLQMWDANAALVFQKTIVVTSCKFSTRLALPAQLPPGTYLLTLGIKERTPVCETKVIVL